MAYVTKFEMCCRSGFFQTVDFLFPFLLLANSIITGTFPVGFYYCIRLSLAVYAVRFFSLTLATGLPIFSILFLLEKYKLGSPELVYSRIPRIGRYVMLDCQRPRLLRKEYIRSCRCRYTNFVYWLYICYVSRRKSVRQNQSPNGKKFWDIFLLNLRSICILSNFV